MVDSTTEPSKMTQEQAINFLEELCSDLESRIEGIKDDMKTDAEC